MRLSFLSRRRGIRGVSFLFAAAALFAATGLSSTAHADPDSDWATASIKSASRASGDGSVSRQRSSRRSYDAPSRLGGPVAERPRPSGSLSGGITWQASAGCVPGQLQGVLSSLVSTFGAVTVTSTCRSTASNRAAGGAKRSYHLSGEAVDFRVRGANNGAVYAFLSSNGSVGGLKHYGGGLFHIDTGPRRPM